MTPLRKGGDHPRPALGSSDEPTAFLKRHTESPNIEKMETGRYAYTDTRRAEKAGSWYEGDLDKLVPQLNGFFAKVPETVDGSSLPIPGARIIIAP